MDASTKTKIMYGAAAAVFLGIILYFSLSSSAKTATKKGGGGEDPFADPSTVAKSIVNNPDGSRTITMGDGKVIKETAAEVKASVIKATKGRGSDGTYMSWSNGFEL